MIEQLLYPIFPALVLGILNWLYWKKKGYTSINQLILGIIVFYAGFYLLFKKLL
jgi:hypothetical protein